MSRPQPFGLHYFEIGNEMYGTWEVDRHGQGGVLRAARPGDVR